MQKLRYCDRRNCSRHIYVLYLDQRGKQTSISYLLMETSDLQKRRDHCHNQLSLACQLRLSSPYSEFSQLEGVRWAFYSTRRRAPSFTCRPTAWSDLECLSVGAVGSVRMCRYQDEWRIDEAERDAMIREDCISWKSHWSRKRLVSRANKNDPILLED